MKRTILTGILAMAAGLSGLLAQQPPAPAAPKIQGPKSKAEQEAVIALQKASQAQDPDATIKAAETLLTKYFDTDFKEFALGMEAQAYQTKRDDVNAQIFGERALEVNPKSYIMELLVAEVISSGIKDHDLDRADKMTKCTKLFNDSIVNVQAAPKPKPQISDADWSSVQKSYVGEAHNGMGMLALADKKYDVAVKEFQVALDNDPQQDAYAARLASSLLSAHQYPECIAVCDKLLAKSDLHPTIKNLVTSIKNEATSRVAPAAAQRSAPPANAQTAPAQTTPPAVQASPTAGSTATEEYEKFDPPGVKVTFLMSASQIVFTNGVPSAAPGASVEKFAIGNTDIELVTNKMVMEGENLVVTTKKFGKIRVVVGGNFGATLWVTPSQKRELYKLAGIN
jgi:tetratricopeptide (TPR) repeat protein